MSLLSYKLFRDKNKHWLPFAVQIGSQLKENLSIANPKMSLCLQGLFVNIYLKGDLNLSILSIHSPSFHSTVFE